MDSSKNITYSHISGIQYVIPALLVYTSRKATAKAIGVGVTNHHKSWFQSTIWIILVNLWAVGCIVLVTWNHISQAINKGQLWNDKGQANQRTNCVIFQLSCFPDLQVFLIKIWSKKWFIQWFLLTLFYQMEYKRELSATFYINRSGCNWFEHIWNNKFPISLYFNPVG